jgi:hypothetical protein
MATPLNKIKEVGKGIKEKKSKQKQGFQSSSTRAEDDTNE